MTRNNSQDEWCSACAKEFCFHWVVPGGYADLSGSLYDSLEAAISAQNTWTQFPEGGCACGFGPCKRLDSTSSEDMYEPHEPKLEAVGLPWDYFVVSDIKDP